MKLKKTLVKSILLYNRATSASIKAEAENNECSPQKSIDIEKSLQRGIPCEDYKRIIIRKN